MRQAYKTSGGISGHQKIFLRPTLRNSVVEGGSSVATETHLCGWQRTGSHASEPWGGIEGLKVP